MKTMQFLIPAIFAATTAAARTPVVDQAVALELMRGAAGQLAAGALQTNPDFARLYSTSVLEQELVQEAARRGLTERLDVHRALTMARYQILIQALQADVVRGLPTPTDAEIKRQYDRNRAEYTLPEAVKADVYVLDSTAPNVTEVSRAAIAAQAIDPAQLQRTRYQQVADAAQVWVARTVFPKDHWTDIRQMNPGQVRLFHMPDGNLLLLKYEDYRAERPATLEEATDDIRQQILNERQQKAWQEFLLPLRRKHGLNES